MQPEFEVPEIGKRIKALADLRSFTAERLATEIACDIDRMRNVWTCKIAPSAEEISRIAEVLEANAEWIYTCRGDPLRPKVERGVMSVPALDHESAKTRIQLSEEAFLRLTEAQLRVLFPSGISRPSVEKKNEQEQIRSVP